MSLRYHNPLQARPSEGTFVGKLHRAGSFVADQVMRVFGVGSVYAGVHVGTHPFVAAAYALNRMRVEPYPPTLWNAPILIGIREECGEPEPDMDVYTTAIRLDEIAQDVYDVAVDELEDDDPSPDEVEEYFEESGEYAEEVTRNLAGHFDTYSAEGFHDNGGVGGLFGTFSNLPTEGSALSAISKLAGMYALDRTDEETLDDALREALRIIPQRRLLCDVEWSDVACLVALAPYRPGAHSVDLEEGFPYYSDDVFLNKIPEDLYDDSIYEEFDDALQEGWLVLYGDPEDARWWHGTGSKATLSAFPKARRYIDLEEISDALIPQRAERLREMEDEDE